jgi:hypothetical protein
MSVAEVLPHRQFSLTRLEVAPGVDPFQVRAEVSIPLAAEEENFAVEGIRAAVQGAAHTRAAAEGNIPLAHICGHMDQDDNPAGTCVLGTQ